MSSPAPASELVVDAPPFARQCLDACRPTWEASFEHPFVRALASGNLDGERFAFYQMQDARYLETFADALALIATRFPSPARKLWFLEAARVALVVEQELHAGYGEELGYTPDDVAALTLTPNGRAYQNHLLASANHGSTLEAVAAVTPCFWLYTELGAHFARELGEITDEHPYANWLRMYSDEGFREQTVALLDHLQELAEEHGPALRQRAVEAFDLSTRYEWMFWDQAWTRQDWPL